ncbi:MAG TPA: hypothetical protein VLD37_04965 [Candidatus Bilamarchaeum sp.]|nr:hypothetical protein [Candidatus Bilamarchaeum sp.]
MRKKLVLTEPSMSGTRKKLSEPVEGNSMAMNELRQLILSNDPKEKCDGAWEVRCRAERGDDITPLVPAVVSALKSEMRSESLRAVKVFLSEALAYCMGKLPPSDDISSTASALLSDPDLHVRYCGGAILYSAAKAGGEIGLYRDILVRAMDDMAPLVQEVSLAALKAQASHGKIEAHQVLLALGDANERLNELVREKRDDLKQHCLSVLSGSQA